jgi:hypothetical protein
LLLDQHRALILVALGAAACTGYGDDRCPGPSTASTCRLARIDGPNARGELGFRFGSPLDHDGDGRLDLVGGSRYGGSTGGGEASAWTQAGRVLAHWDGPAETGLFGQDTVPMPDLDGDGAPDVIVSAPTARLDGGGLGFVDAYSVRDGRRLWHVESEDGLGWQMERAGDHDGDGVEDLWVSATASPIHTRVVLLSGRDGHVVHTITSTRSEDRFGFYFAPMGDLDGDGEDDIAIGAPGADVDGKNLGVVTLASAATGATLREIVGDLADHQFGEMLAPLDDLDGDGLGDLAIAAPEPEHAGGAPGDSEVLIYSSATGERLHLLVAQDPDELYGRMLATLADLDGDGLRDLAIGAPWWSSRRGRIEVRSSRTLAILAEIHGDEPGGWLGWHIARADGDGPGLVTSVLEHDTKRGALELHAFR